MDSKANNINVERFLLCVRFAKTKTGDVYIKARCAAEISKKLIYELAYLTYDNVYCE